LSFLPRQQPPPIIRTGTTVVPVDVRALDLSGKPVTDLKRSDFTVLEDGRPQEIQLFDARGLVASRPEDATPLLRTAASDAAPGQAQDRRVLLFLFGRGRHQSSDKAIDAVSRFVRDSLLPQDRVAVLAYNRATDFTVDREALL